MNSKTLGGREAEVLHKTLNRLISKEPTILIKSKPQMTIEQQIDELTKRISVLESKASVYGLGSKLNLVEMEEKFDKILESQTPEDTIKWLKEKRGEKLEPEKDYEIIEHGSDFDLKTKELSGPIFKVRRLSDRVEFKISDEVVTRTEPYIIREIKSFQVSTTDEMITGVQEVGKPETLEPIFLSFLQPAPKKPEPLFVTEDGKPVFNDTDLCYAVDNNFIIVDAIAEDAVDIGKVFSNEASAEEYVCDHKKEFSAKEVWEMYDLTPAQIKAIARERCGFTTKVSPCIGHSVETRKHMNLEQLSIDHDYYASEINFYSNDAGGRYATWADFYEEFHDADIDMNLVFRWDIFKRENSGRYHMLVIIIAQRKGIYMPIEIDYVDEHDVPQIESFMKPHFEKLLKNWQPLSSKYLGQETEKEEGK